MAMPALPTQTEMETTPSALAPLSAATTAALRSVYLQRLQRLQRLRLQHEQELNRQGLRLLDRSAFAAYCVLRDVGAEEEALAALREAHADADCHVQALPQGQLDY